MDYLEKKTKFNTQHSMGLFQLCCFFLPQSPIKPGSKKKDEVYCATFTLQQGQRVTFVAIYEQTLARVSLNNEYLNFCNIFITDVLLTEIYVDFILFSFSKLNIVFQRFIKRL